MENENTVVVHAYTPGLKVKKYLMLEKVRRLPVAGEIYVNLGEKVAIDSVIASTKLPGDPHVLSVATAMDCEPWELNQHMTKKIGDMVNEGDSIAKASFFFGLIKKNCKSPCNGIIETISDTTGNVIIRGEDIHVEVNAYIPGTIVKILPEEGAVISTNAAYIQGIFGIGGETHGDLVLLLDSPHDILSSNLINESHKGKIIAGGSIITIDALRKAKEFGVSGIITGGIDDADLIDYLGYEIGVAITGHEQLGITLILTEGFGQTSMSTRTFKLLKSLEGHHASISGATQIRAGVIRPEIIIPHSGEQIKSDDEDELIGGMKPGTLLRIIREPHFGETGRVTSLPVELQVIESGSQVRVVEVELEKGSKVIVPRANVEIIEE